MEPQCEQLQSPEKNSVASRPTAAFVWMLALLGSIGGTVTAFFQNTAHSFTGILLVVVVAPAVEEICKPLGIVFLLDKRPKWLRSGREIVVLAMMSGFVFASLENLLYIFVNNPDGSLKFILWRLIVCTGMHVTCSTIFGVGLVKMWKHIQAKGGHFDIDVCFRYYVIAAVVHGSYNGLATIATLLGWLKF